MNVGIYVENLGEARVIDQAYTCLETLSEQPEVEDVVLFYDNPGQALRESSFGLFNSVDIWHFKGVLIVTFLSGLSFVNNTINDQKIVYYYGLEDKPNLFSLLKELENKDITVATTAEHAKEFTRLTGIEPVICEGLKELTKVEQYEYRESCQAIQ